MHRPFAFLACAALAIAAAPLPALAAPPEEDPLAEAKQLYTDGQNCFDLADYLCAIKEWTSAFGATPNEPAHVQTRIALLNNLATAREKAYELTTETIHLKQARDLLGRFKDNIPALKMGEAEEADAIARIDERVAAIDAELAAAEQREQNPDFGTDPDQPDPVEPEGPTEPAPGGPDDGGGSTAKPGTPLVIAGGVLLGLGVGGAVLAAVGLGQGSGLNTLPANTTVEERDNLASQGRTMNTLAYVGGIGGIVLLGAGAALVAVGLSKNAKAAQTTARLAPYGSGREAGLVLTGRF